MTPQRLNDEVVAFHRQLTFERRRYWQERGIASEILDTMRIGYDPAKEQYILPYFDEQGDCHCYKTRDLRGNHSWYPAGLAEVTRIYNLRDLVLARETHQRLLVAEGESDCLTLQTHGYLCVGIPGAKAFKPDYVPLFAGVPSIIICFDNDPPGQEGGHAIVKLFHT